MAARAIKNAVHFFTMHMRAHLLISQLAKNEVAGVPIGHVKGALLAAIAGATLPFAFAPFELYFLSPLSLSVLFLLCRISTPATAALSGMLFGIGVFPIAINKA